MKNAIIKRSHLNYSAMVFSLGNSGVHLSRETCQVHKEGDELCSKVVGRMALKEISINSNMHDSYSFFLITWQKCFCNEHQDILCEQHFV